jgi:hypothetical protein
MRGSRHLEWWSMIARLPVYLMALAVVLIVREHGGS